MLTAVSCLFSHHFAISQADIHFQKKLTVFSPLHLKMCQNHRLRQNTTQISTMQLFKQIINLLLACTIRKSFFLPTKVRMVSKSINTSKHTKKIAISYLQQENCCLTLQSVARLQNAEPKCHRIQIRNIYNEIDKKAIFYNPISLLRTNMRANQTTQ